MRIIENINFNWLYKKENDTDDFRIVDIPHTNVLLPYSNFDEKIYQFKSIYKKEIFIDEDKVDMIANLHFEGIMSHCNIYLNDNFICSHSGGYTEFNANITDHIKYGEVNTIRVNVDSTEREDIPPFGNVLDYLTYGGIYREVRLEYTNKNYIDNVKIETSNVLLDEKSFNSYIYLNDYFDNFSIKIDIISLKEKIHSYTKIINNDSKKIFNISFNISDVFLWSIDSPILYTAKISIIKNNSVIDSLSTRFGFRHGEFKNDGFYLNGERLKLIGLNRHQSFPYIGYSATKSLQVKDADILKKELGVNIVRTSHYPQSRHFLNRCDEIGLLVFEEIPGWQFVSDNPIWQENCLKSVKEMITSHWNHPSIVIWGTRINESPDNNILYKKTSSLAKKLDKTRQIGGVRDFANSRLFEDVYTVNDFTHDGSEKILANKKDMTKINIPYLVTEFNGHMYPTKSFDNQDRKLEHALRHLRVLNKMYKEKDIIGAIGWCMSDYNTHMEFGSGDKICYHGVLDMFRIPKYAASVYSSQQNMIPYSFCANTLDNGDRDRVSRGSAYIFTNCDFLKLYVNNIFIGDYYPEKNKYKHIPNPPIIVDDFIGDLIEKNEYFNKQDSAIAKDILEKIDKYGHLNSKYKEKLKILLDKYNINFKKFISLHAKYFGGWGEKSIEYRFDIYKDSLLVETIKKGKITNLKMIVEADSYILKEEESYDMTRVIVKLVDQYGNIPSYTREVVEISSDNLVSVIGPTNLAVINGITAFYIRSKSIKGESILKINSQRFGEIELKFEIVTNIY